MVTATEYLKEHNALMEEFEMKVRSWLREKGEHQLADKIPFFRDGVVCPEKWFAENNDFRPLFIMKEVSIGRDNISDVDGFNKRFGNQKFFEFAMNPFDDIQIGSFRTWRKIARLAKGFEEIHNGVDACDYYKYDFSYDPSGEKYTGEIEGYLTGNYINRTANQVYNDIMQRIAVLEIKKIGGGSKVSSELSIATGYYSEHIAPFEDLICKQIELMDPTVIICCSREIFTYNLLAAIKEKTKDRLWIYGYHPASWASTEKYYYEPLRIYKESRK